MPSVTRVVLAGFFCYAVDNITVTNIQLPSNRGCSRYL